MRSETISVILRNLGPIGLLLAVAVYPYEMSEHNSPNFTCRHPFGNASFFAVFLLKVTLHTQRLMASARSFSPKAVITFMMVSKLGGSYSEIPNN